LYAGFLGMEDEDEDEDEDDDDEDEDEEDDLALSTGRYAGATSPFTGMKLDPWDPNPLIKPRPSRYFRNEDDDFSSISAASSSSLSTSSTVPDSELKQTMTDEERQENLSIMRRIRKSDLPDLRLRKDHAGWVEANNDLKRRLAKDPWFGLNERLREAIQLGYSQDKIDYLQKLVQQVGGPPPGLKFDETKGYAVHTEIYEIGLSPSRAASMLEREIRAERAARGRAMMAERKKNQEAAARQYEEDLRNPGVRADKEAKERRERTLRRVMAELEEDNKKKRERAKELLGKLPETPESRTAAMQKALKEAREEFKKSRRSLAAGKGLGDAATLGTDEDDDDDDDATSIRPKSGAERAREAANAEAAGGRPRLPGDDDVTRGELDPSTPVQESSVTVTGPLQVEVSSSYNKEQSDPPMRKHCFQYTIRITNQSPTDTIQLLGRRFEIQTVGSSMKDVVQGEGVTGRTPVLQPGEVFEYTSTAPLSVRPLGTTIIAARMRGDYRYAVLPQGTTEANVEASTTDNLEERTAELGTFHFVFPEEQRVQPFRAATEDEEEEEEEDDDDVVDTKAATTTTASSSAATKPSSPTPSSTLPGDKDMIEGNIAIPLNDSSEATTEDVRVQVTSSYRPERSDDAMGKHCFAYNIRITNESNQPIQLVSRRFEIQTIGSQYKDVVQGPGVTGRQPILQPGESFEYTSTAPLSVRPMLDKTPVVARMQGEYNFVKLKDDASAPLSSTPLQAKLALFHFILPAVV
jgi:ApaG protein